MVQKTNNLQQQHKTACLLCGNLNIWVCEIWMSII